jgi:hypothetical protein
MAATDCTLRMPVDIFERLTFLQRIPSLENGGMEDLHGR